MLCNTAMVDVPKHKSEKRLLSLQMKCEDN